MGGFSTEVRLHDPDVQGYKHDGRNWEVQFTIILLAGAFEFKSWLTEQAMEFYKCFSTQARSSVREQGLIARAEPAPPGFGYPSEPTVKKANTAR